jgi:hypothetical protein
MSEEHILVVAPAGHKVQVLTGGLWFWTKRYPTLSEAKQVLSVNATNALDKEDGSSFQWNWQPLGFFCYSVKHCWLPRTRGKSNWKSQITKLYEILSHLQDSLHFWSTSLLLMPLSRS